MAEIDFSKFVSNIENKKVDIFKMDIPKPLETFTKDLNDALPDISFTSSEKNNYIKQQNKCKFKTPEEEYEWSKTQKNHQSVFLSQLDTHR